jgi:phosphoenolpyruvate carboxylase
MRWWLLGALMALGIAAPAGLAQDQPTYEQLKKLYDDTLKQLEAAQNRKNQLSSENEWYKAELAKVTKQLDDTKARLDALQRDAQQWAEKTFFYRSHYAAWRQFIKQYPRLCVRWDIWLEGKDLDTGGTDLEILDPPPLPPPPPPPPPPPTTAPTTRP